MSNKKLSDIPLTVVSNSEKSEMKMFPDGCGGCPGVCCITICGQPPNIMPNGGPSKKCCELTDDGLCGIHLRHGYEKKPNICKTVRVGSDECLDARREAGL